MTTTNDEEHESGPTARNEIPSRDDLRVVDALRRGDESAFAALVERYHASLVRLAMAYVSNYAVAEDVAQEAWVGVLRGLDRFEGRSSLKTWIYRILVNTAKTRAVREGRSIPFSALTNPLGDADEPAVDPDRFAPPEAPLYPGHWTSPPRTWDMTPEDMLMSSEVRMRIDAAIDDLSPGQKQVITLRDIEGLTSDEVCNVLGLSETNQRVLLHRARSKVRAALERYFDEEAA